MTLLLQGAGLQTVTVPIPPEFDSAEVGSVNASTVVVTFTHEVSASNYGTGVVIKVNGSGATISTSTRQANHAIVYYTLSAPCISTDTVTWEYSAAAGEIVAESDGSPLEDVSAQTVTNNVSGVTLPDVASATRLMDLRASDFAGLADDASIGNTWTSHDALVRVFTRGTGATGLTKVAIDGHIYVSSNGANDWMLGQNWPDLDNLLSFTIFKVYRASEGPSFYSPHVTKIGNDGCSDPGSNGWSNYGTNIILYTDSGNYIYQSYANPPLGYNIATYEVISKSELHCYINGSLSDKYENGGSVGGGGVGSYATSEPLRLFTDGLGASGDNSCVGFAASRLCAYLIYAPAPNVTDRAAIEAWLAVNT